MSKRTFGQRVKGTLLAVRDQWRPQSIADLDRQIESAGAPSVAGVRVSAERAMNFSAFFNGVLQISQTVASLPCLLYQREGETSRRRYTGHPAYRVLKERPNSLMNAFTFGEQAMYHAIVWGNAYARIHRDVGNRVTGLTPLHPGKTFPRLEGNSLWYLHKPDGGRPEKLYPQDQILHVPGFGFNGIEGYALIRLARESLGLGLALEHFASNFFGRGTHIGGVLKHPGTLTKEAHENLKADFREKYSGLGNAHKAIVLEEGMEWASTVMPMDDAQFLESRVFSIQEIARWLNMPPHKLKELSKATFDNIASEQISWLQDTIRPWLVRLETAYTMQLLSDEDRAAGAYFEFLIDALLRSDIKTRFEAYGIALDKGWMNRDEVRARENLNPMGGGGQIHTVQLAMVDINDLGRQPDSTDEVVDEESSFPGGFNADDRSLARRIPDMRVLEVRAQRSIMHKRQHALSTKSRFERAVWSILAFEIPGVMKTARANLGERKQADFRDELSGFYERHRAEMTELFKRGVVPLAEGIRAIAATEVGGFAGGDPEFEQFIDDFVRITVSQYIRSSMGQLVKIADDAEDGGPLAEIEMRTERWKDTRPGQVARRQIVDGENAAAQFVYFAAGFMVRWVTVGQSCAYCNAMNGKVIRQGERFIERGSELEPTGAKGPMKITNNISHPALHAGCDCTTVATVF